MWTDCFGKTSDLGDKLGLIARPTIHHIIPKLICEVIGILMLIITLLS